MALKLARTRYRLEQKRKQNTKFMMNIENNNKNNNNDIGSINLAAFICLRNGCLCVSVWELKEDELNLDHFTCEISSRQPLKIVYLFSCI